MKLYFYIITLFVFSISSLWSHDVPMASFHIYEDGNEIKIDVVFDLEDISNTLNIGPEQVDLKSLDAYLCQKTEFRFNSIDQEIILEKISNEGDHIKVSGRFEILDLDIKKLEIWNTCLIENRKHSNIIQTDLNGSTKDFRMHKDRTIISMTY